MIHITPEARNDTLDALSLSERFLLWNVRAWACSCRGQRLPAEPVRLAFQNIGIPAAAVAVDAAMTHLVLATRRPLAVNCPSRRGLSGDETMLIGAAAAGRGARPGRTGLRSARRHPRRRPRRGSPSKPRALRLGA